MIPIHWNSELAKRLHIRKPLPKQAMIRLGTRTLYRDGTKIERELWSGCAFPVVGEHHGFLILQGKHGTFGRRWDKIKIA